MSSNVTIKGNLKIDKNLSVDKNSNVKGQITINQLFGGIRGREGWRTIKVNGGDLAFDIGANKFGFHSNTNGIHYARSNKYKQLPIYKGVFLNGKVYANKLFVKDFINARGINIKNDRGKGTTIFNYNNTGNNYIRGNLRFDNGGITINGDLNTIGAVTAEYIIGNR